MYQTAAYLPATRLQHTTLRTNAHNSAHNRIQHFSHKWQSAILTAMQNVLILLATNRNFSNAQRHGTVLMQPHMFVVKSTAVTDNMHTI